MFAAPSFYWAAGGTANLESTVAPDLVRLTHDRVPWFVAVLWITGALKVFAGLLALALVRKWGRIFPDWMLLILAGGAGTLVLGRIGQLENPLLCRLRDAVLKAVPVEVQLRQFERVMRYEERRTIK